MDPLAHIWTINNRTEAFDLEDELDLHVFEQMCFLHPKLPIGESRQHCFARVSHESAMIL